MNIEWETKIILSRKDNPEKIAEKICDFATFKKENIIKALKWGGKDMSEIYGNIILFEEKQKWTLH
jgi:hypothetical protein